MDLLDEWRECLWRRSRNAAPVAASVVLPPMRNSEEQASAGLRGRASPAVGRLLRLPWTEDGYWHGDQDL